MILSAFANLLNRILNLRERYEARLQRKQQAARRQAVNADPVGDFANEFGEPDSVSDSTAGTASGMQSNAAAPELDEKQ
jgi:hypothetical protein